MWTVLTILVLLVQCVRKGVSEWGLKDMGRSYSDSRAKDETTILDSSNYVPLRHNQLCDEFPALYSVCRNESRRLNVLVVDQLPVMATQLGCGKRMFHLLEALVGIGTPLHFIRATLVIRHFPS
jgi:hypothetical protein